jgi:hypothetical protein
MTNMKSSQVFLTNEINCITCDEILATGVRRQEQNPNYLKINGTIAAITPVKTTTRMNRLYLRS